MTAVGGTAACARVLIPPLPLAQASPCRRQTSYNALATAYIRPEWYAGVPPHLPDPARRVPALVRQVEGPDADLLCLQEVEAETSGALDRRLKTLGYEGRYEKKGRGKPDGCATFFRKGVFALRRVRRLDYRDGERGTAGDSGHIALLLGLEHEGRLLGVANTHLRWDRPGTPPDEQPGHRQVRELLGLCGRFTPACRGWLVCGDFNRTPDGAVVALMRQAGYGYAHAGRPDARSAVANGKANLIDHVFCSRELRAQPIDPPTIEDDTCLPSQEQPSDHLALVAEIDWA